ncbi:MAG TPA: hypothetical protein VL404_06190 [Candidatus Eisenbacteria bacterium]|jgi:hypothetical protein|nr:hypothetical protein [Candidatus Eisenbacteria bacterium]
MFDKMKGMMDQFQMMQRLMKDENFRAFLAHPKVQELFRDPEFKEVAKSRDFAKISGHPKFAALARDPEVAQLMAKLNPQSFLQP